MYSNSNCRVAAVLLNEGIFSDKGQFRNDFLGSSISSKIRTKTSRILVKTNSFVRFLEEFDDPISHFEVNFSFLGIYEF